MWVKKKLRNIKNKNNANKKIDQNNTQENRERTNYVKVQQKKKIEQKITFIVLTN